MGIALLTYSVGSPADFAALEMHLGNLRIHRKIDPILMGRDTGRGVASFPAMSQLLAGCDHLWRSREESAMSTWLPVIAGLPVVH